jgi:hypothetical protein
MEKIIKENFYNKLDYDRIKINWNTKRIEMGKFLSFLTVPVLRLHDHLGSTNGWTLLENKDIGLRIGGGVVDGVEYLDTIQFGVKLANDYNNYVNPFYIFIHLSNEGRAFFVDYYAEDINGLIADQQYGIARLEKSLDHAREVLKAIETEYANLKNA